MNDASFAQKNGRYLPGTGRARAEGDAAPEEAHAVPIATQYMRILMRWRWLILGTVALTVAAGLIFTLLATRLYTAVTLIEIDRGTAQIVEGADVRPQTSPVDTEFYQTQYGLLRSRALADRVVKDLRLADDETFFSLFGKSAEYEKFSGTSAREKRARLASDILLKHSAISPVRLSRLVEISFTSPDPNLSARVANAWTKEFIESNLERRFEATAYARRFLEQKLVQLRPQLEESERQLVAYASSQAIINIPMSGGASAQPQERSLTADSLAALNTALAEATAERVGAQSRVDEGGNGAVTEALTNPAITAMRQRRAEAAAEYARLMTQFEPEYPPARALNSQINQLDRSIAREVSRVQATLKNNYENSIRRETALSQRVEDLKRGFIDQRRRSIQYNILQRNVEANRALYDAYLQRFRTLDAAAGVGTNNVAIVDPARVPDKTSYPRPLINLAIALAVGLIAGIGLALVREQIDESVSDPAELERRVGVPLLGVVPTSKNDDLLADLRDPKSSLLEAYLSLQTNLGFSTDHGIPRTLTVTSTRPAEGKSTTAYALAYTIARRGARTLLIDGDMRSPSVHEEVGLKNVRGLSTYLSGSDDWQGVVQQPEGLPFAVLPAGPQPPNAAELLRSARFEHALAELLTRFDHIVIDAPPVMGLADAPIIGSRAEATIFVMEASGVKARVARVAINRLRQVRADLLGVVLTKFETKQHGFGYGYEYGYGYSYGSDEKDAVA